MTSQITLVEKLLKEQISTPYRETNPIVGFKDYLAKKGYTRDALDHTMVDDLREKRVYFNFYNLPPRDEEALGWVKLRASSMIFLAADNAVSIADNKDAPLAKKQAAKKLLEDAVRENIPAAKIALDHMKHEEKEGYRRPDYSQQKKLLREEIDAASSEQRLKRHAQDVRQDIITSEVAQEVQQVNSYTATASQATTVGGKSTAVTVKQ